MKTIIIKEKNELLKYKTEILKLFRDAYGQELSGILWDWAYIHNPFGNPYVALAFDDVLVAHYAVIPYPLSDGAGVRYKSFLSMTTMVAESHRKYGLFTKLANAVYDELRIDDADWVMGFPNQMSAPGFRKRLGWKILDPDCVISVDKSMLTKISHLEFSDKEVRLFADLASQDIRDWRLSKPNTEYVWNDGVAYKEFSGHIDVMYYRFPDDLLRLPDSNAYNILVPRHIVDNENIVAFDYMFGGLSLNKEFMPSMVRRQMCLSDVF